MSVLALPADVLERVLLLVCLEDRVRFVSVCRQLAEYGASAASLWEAASIDFGCLGHEGAEQFAEWCGGQAGRRLKRLQLCIPYTPDNAFLQGEAARISIAILGRLAAAAVGAPLISLDWQTAWPAQQCFGAVLQFRQLKQLVMRGPLPLHLLHELSLLSALTSLGLSYTTCTFAPSCLPGGLRALAAGLASPVLPPAILAATRLERLQLSLEPDAAAPLNCSGLERLTRLSHLALHTCELTQLPSQLLTLSMLHALDLVGNHNLSGASLAHLTALPALRELDLCHCGLTALPAQLLSQLRLEALSVGYNHLHAGLPRAVAPAALQRLQALGTDAAAFCASAPLLRQLTALTRLCLTVWSPPDTDHWDWEALSPALRQLPQLRILGYYGSAHLPAGLQLWVQEQMTAVQQSLPRLECRQMEGLLLPAEEAHAVRWDEVD